MNALDYKLLLQTGEVLAPGLADTRGHENLSAGVASLV